MYDDDKVLALATFLGIDEDNIPDEIEHLHEDTYAVSPSFVRDGTSVQKALELAGLLLDTLKRCPALEWQKDANTPPVSVGISELTYDKVREIGYNSIQAHLRKAPTRGTQDRDP